MRIFRIYADIDEVRASQRHEQLRVQSNHTNALPTLTTYKVDLQRIVIPVMQDSLKNKLTESPSSIS